MDILEQFILKSKENIHVPHPCEEDDIFLFSSRKSEKINNENIKLLEALFLPVEIFQQTLTFYKNTIHIDQFKRIKFRKSIMCAGLSLSLSLHNKNILSEKELLKYFNVEKSKYVKGLKIIKIVNNECRGVKFLVVDELFNIIQELKLEKDFDVIKSFIRTFTDDISIKAEACAFLYIWILINKKNVIDFLYFCSLCNLSVSVIKKLIYKNEKVIDKFYKEYSTQLISEFIKKIKLPIDQEKTKELILSYLAKQNKIHALLKQIL
nr:MAG: hypothetical protein DiTV3a_F14ORF3 [Diabrotica toursvirus 3a]